MSLFYIRKLFVGGVSWETTEGMIFLVVLAFV